jgi:hypothetical protein
VTLEVRPLRAGDLEKADRIFRVACGTFLRLPNPLAFAGDTDYVRSRFRTIIQGVAMHRPNAPGYSRSEVYAIDDWR